MARAGLKIVTYRDQAAQTAAGAPAQLPLASSDAGVAAALVATGRNVTELNEAAAAILRVRSLICLL